MLKIETNTQWSSIYKTAGVMALLIALAGIVDALTSNMGVGAEANNLTQAAEWFSLFQSDPFQAFSCLGIINIFTLSMGIPIYLALYQAQRRYCPVPIALAVILFFVGVAVYLSSNTAFPLYALSRQYAVVDAAQKPILEAAGRALLVQGADLTPGTFLGFFFTQTAGLLATSVMFKGRVFSKWVGGTGLAGYAMMSVFFVLAAFLPEKFDIAMFFAMPGGMLLLVYELLLARRFFQLGK